MLLLWQNNVPVSIEVLLCSNCRVSQQKVRSVEFSTIPEPGSILLEQWTVSIQTKSKSLRGQHLISSHGLFQAVRSYLHFSQLSAWYSSSRGNYLMHLYHKEVQLQLFLLPFKYCFLDKVVDLSSSRLDCNGTF